MNAETRTFLYGLMLIVLGWYVCDNGLKCDMWGLQLFQLVIGTMCIALGTDKINKVII